MSYFRLIEKSNETTPLLRNRFKSNKPVNNQKEDNIVEHNQKEDIIVEHNHQDINNFVASYLLDNIKINNNNVTFNNSEEQLKEDIIRICKNSTDNFNTKQIKNYIMKVCNAYESSDNFVFYIHRLKSYGLHNLYLVNNIFCYIDYMFSGARYNYHNFNSVCFEFNKLNITQEQIDKIKNKDVSEIANLIIILLQCDNCEFGVNETIIDVEEIIIN
jgi:hypothetical protein